MLFRTSPSDDDLLEVIKSMPPERPPTPADSLLVELATRQLHQIRRQRVFCGADAAALLATLAKLGI